MKKPTPKNKTLIGFILYGFVLMVCLLYLLFPSDVFRQYLITTANTANPRFRVSAEDARLWLPFGVKFHQTQIFLKEMPDMEIFHAERLMIRPAIGSLLKGRSGFVFDCNAYEGNLSGDLQFSKKGITSPFSTSIKLEKVSIGDYNYLSVLTRRNLSGILDGRIIFRGLTDGTGEADLKITDGGVELKEPLFNLESINFDELDIKLVLRDQKVELSHVKMRGREVQGVLAGTIRLKRDLLKSGLDLRGSIEMGGDLFKGSMGNAETSRPLKLPFVIQGTIMEPRFRLT